MSDKPYSCDTVSKKRSMPQRSRSISWPSQYIILLFLLINRSYILIFYYLSKHEITLTFYLFKFMQDQ